MATDGIRLPSDTTVTSQRVTRGAGLPETQPLPTNTDKVTVQPSPLLTVVLQANPLIEGGKGSLYELVLQNDPKDQPVIKLPADTYIAPGTSLLLEKDDSGQYKPVDKPSQEQLAKLILLELDYQRAHLLPKIDASADSAIFKLATTASLISQYPELKPLLNWLTQTTTLNGPTLLKVMQEFTPLSNLRPWANLLASLSTNTNLPTTAQAPQTSATTIPTSSNPTSSNPTSAIPTSAPISANASQSAVLTTALSTFISSGPLTTTNLLAGALQGTSSQAASVITNLISDPRLPAKIGLTTPTLAIANSLTPASTSAITATQVSTQTTPQPEARAQMVTALQTMAVRTGLAINGVATTQSNSATPLTNALTSTPTATAPTVTQTATTNNRTTANTTATAQAPTLASLPIANGLLNGLTNQPTLLNQIVNILTNRALSSTSVELPLQPQTTPANPAQVSKSSLSTAGASLTQAAQPPGSPTGTQSSAAAVTMGSLNASAETTTTTLQSPIVEGRIPSEPPSRNPLPLEVTLSQWLEKIDTLIQQSPSQMRQQLAAQAEQLIQQMAQQPNKIVSDLASATPQSNSQEEPLLALRSWLEATQSRLQNVAVQTAAQHWATPDQPPVQQMQLPLIWLGLTAWADVEWWQDPKKQDDKKKSNKEQQRRWRMKVYLTLEPLSQMCADIEWSTDYTQLTFWSEDSATLNHLSNLLPTLESWTAGLGDRALQTKHGMPKRVNQETEQPNKHLVDIRT